MNPSFSELLEAAKRGESLRVTVRELVTGGLRVVTDEGHDAFMPSSQAGLDEGRTIWDLIGQTMEVTLFAIDRYHYDGRTWLFVAEGEPVRLPCVSRKLLLERQREQQRQSTLDQLAVGSRIEGRVKAVLPYGAFIDLGGIDGLLHSSRMPPGSELHVEQVVMVEVLELNRDRFVIHLALATTD